MDALPLPVLSVWAVDGDPSPPLPGLSERVPGCARTPEEALARARELHPGRDVLLLRADAQAPADLWRRLEAAWHEGDWDVLSVIDGRWPVFPAGVGAGARDALAWACGEHASFAWQGWSATCSLWRGQALHSSLPSAAVPRRGALLPCIYVGPELMGDEAFLPSPLARLAERIAEQYLQTGDQAATTPVVLHVLHSWGGGIERFVRDLMTSDRERRHMVLVARNEADRPPFGRQLQLHASLDAPPLRSWRLADPVVDTSAGSAEVRAILETVIAEWGVGAVLVSSLIGHSLDVLRTGLPTSVCVHDCYPAWPLLHEIRDPLHHAFDRASLETALAEAPAGPGFVFSHRDADTWWSLREEFIRALVEHDVTLVAPSDAARQRLCAIAPALADRSWQVIPHGLAPLPAGGTPPKSRPAGAPLRVLVPGRLDGGKGEHLVSAVLAALPAGIELVLLGSGNAGLRLAEKWPALQIHRDYVRDELADWVTRLAPDLALLPSTLPETFSYTLSEMHALGLPVLCTAPGAPAERLRAGGGWAIAPEPAAVVAELVRLAADRSALHQAAAPAPASLEEMAAAWRSALPCRETALQLPTAGPETLARVDAESGAYKLRLRTQQQDRELAQAREELQRRADWAHSLMRERDHLKNQPQANPLNRHDMPQDQTDERDLEIARLEDYIGELDQQLAEAHGYYQRDSIDLANQRDVAVKQRDEALATLRSIHGNPFWRLTSLPRRVFGAVHNLAVGLVYHVRHWQSLSSRGITSLRIRGIAGTWERLRERRQISHPGTSTPTVRPEPERALRLPRPAAPRASIIIPVYNQLHFSLACLRALTDCGDRSAFEVIVVDDSSSDATPRVLPSIPGLRYHRNPQNLGFIGACNAGAELARGEFLVFLNNDTTVRPGWLDALLQTFEDHPDTGLAGSKLVYPDGRLQEAGGIVFADGSGWNYGRFDDPTHPRFNFVREVDYCSGASIALRRDLFMRLDGFDSHYAPAYYEDTDLAMRVRALGLKVRYQPASVVVHHEGVSSGTDVRQGVKAYQVVNREKFAARWKDQLAAGHAPPGSDPERASDRGRNRQVLLLDACTPTPDRDSGSVRMLALMRLLRDEGCAVAFFPENRAHDGRYTEAVQQLGIEAWWQAPLGDVPRWLAKHGRRFDTIIVSRHYVLSPLLPLLRLHAPRAKIVFDTVDLHHLREQREAELSGDPAQLRAAARTRKLELGLIASCDRTWVVSEAERALLAQEIPRARVDVVSNIHSVHGAGLPWQERKDLLFVGSYRHPPNVDAALWLAQEILPRIRAQLPDVTLNLVGGDAPESVVALGEQPGIRYHGYLPDLQPLLVGARIGLAPLRYGAGVKGKVNQSLAHGLPVVATLCAVEGMHLVDGRDVLVADDPADFADAVVRLYGDEATWQQLAHGGLENTRLHFSDEPVRLVLRDLFKGAARH